MAAQDLNDLFAGTPIEDLLYRRLRQTGLLPEREFHVTITQPGKSMPTHYFLDMAVLCAQRSLDIECDGDTWHSPPENIRTDNERDNSLNANLWHVMRFNTIQLTQDMGSTLNIIREAAHRYGGVMDPGEVVRRFGKDGQLGPGQAVLDFS